MRNGKLKPARRYVGYARNFGNERDMARQLHALCAIVEPRHLHVEDADYSRKHSPQREWMLRSLRPGDVVVVANLMCFSLSHSQILKCLKVIEKEQAHILCLDEGIDTRIEIHNCTIPQLKRYLRFRQSHHSQITKAGLMAARVAGKIVGRPKTVTAEKLADAQEHLNAGLSLKEAARTVGLSRSSLYSAGLKVRTIK